jgi:ferredoxin
MVSMDLFDLDDNGNGVVQDAHPGPEHAAAVDLAIRSCPEQAITYG